MGQYRLVTPGILQRVGQNTDAAKGAIVVNATRQGGNQASLPGGPSGWSDKVVERITPDLANQRRLCGPLVGVGQRLVVAA
jgi:hypothetical protein